MKIYSYAIIDSNSKISDSINGLEGVGVYNIYYRDIGIVVSELSEQIQDITQEHILKHEEVVEKLMESFTVLPVSFLTLFKKKDDVLLMMREYYSDFRENLDRLRNKVEFGIKVLWPGDTIKGGIITACSKGSVTEPTVGNSSGKKFIKDRFEKYKIDKKFEEEADRYIAVVDSFLSGFASEKKLEKLKSKNLLLNASYLVGKEKQGDFKQAFKRLKTAPEDLKYLFSGPWPPYNFIVLTKNADMFNRKPINQDLAGKNTL